MFHRRGTDIRQKVSSFQEVICSGIGRKREGSEVISFTEKRVSPQLVDDIEGEIVAVSFDSY